MNQVFYAKFSRERRREFQISTRIEQDETGERRVYKEALTKEAVSHVERMFQNGQRLTKLCGYQGLCISACRKDGEGKVSFPYIEGKNMDQLLTDHIKAEDYAAVRSDVEFLSRIIHSVAGLAPFESSQEFREIFGELELPEGLKAAPVSNLDMLFSNIIVGDQYYLIDYEWVFDFMIPTAFLFARSLLLHGAFQTLPEEMRMELYALGGIEPQQISLYYDMEVRFQKYVTGKEELYVLSKLFPRMKTSCFFLENWDTAHICYPVRVLGIPWKEEDKPTELYCGKFAQNEVKESISIPNTSLYREFMLLPVDTEAVLRLDGLQGWQAGSNMPKDLTVSDSNAQLNYDNVYYFQQPPEMKIKNDGYEQLILAYYLYHRNDFLIKQEIDFRLENERLHKELRKYTGRLHNRILRKIGSLLKKR